MHQIDPAAAPWSCLTELAWGTRENAVAARTKVGAAVLADDGRAWGGCNIEDLWKASSIHAERCAIANAVAHGAKRIKAVLVAAAREKFTPCGNCMDFLMQFGGPECLVGFQPARGQYIEVCTAADLMPHYPR